MEHAHQNGRAWRTDMEKWLREELGHGVINPVRDSERLLTRFGGEPRVRTLKAKDPDGYARIVSKLVAHDLGAISKRTDYLICLWDRSAVRGAGTQGEITLARFLGRPVYLVTRRDHSRIPGWILACATETFPSFSALKKFLKKIHS